MEKAVKKAHNVDKMTSFSDSPFVQKKISRAVKTLSQVDPAQLEELRKRAGTVSC